MDRGLAFVDLDARGAAVPPWRLELVAELFAVGELLEEFAIVFGGDGGAEGLQAILVVADRLQDLVAILAKDFAPEFGAAGGDAGGVAQSVAAVAGGGGAASREEGREGGGENVG